MNESHVWMYIIPALAAESTVRLDVVSLSMAAADSNSGRRCHPVPGRVESQGGGNNSSPGPRRFCSGSPAACSVTTCPLRHIDEASTPRSRSKGAVGWRSGVPGSAA
jgi:hypothetical protein